MGVYICGIKFKHMNYTKKPFDLEYMKANTNTKLVTRDGRKVTGWHYFESATEMYPIVCVLNGEIERFTKEGFYYESKRGNLNDLFMLVPVEELVRYANVYEDNLGTYYSNIEKCIKGKNTSPTHIVKITTSEGDPPTFEIVHTY